MTYAIRVLIAVCASSVAFAAPAAADQDGYLQTLQPLYVNLSAQQLLDEGAKVCEVISSGNPSPTATVMVSKDLGISLAASLDIVSAAVAELDC